jgi:hypothetical protein
MAAWQLVLAFITLTIPPAILAKFRRRHIKNKWAYSLRYDDFR